MARMNRFRSAFVLASGGFALKGAAVIVYDLVHTPILGRLLISYDPLGARFADAVLPQFFDLRGIAPPAGANTVYEILLVIAFAAQCFVLGLAITETRRLIRGRDSLPQ